MSSKVFYGSPRQARLEAKETLPAKLELILDQLHLRDRVKDETVVIKMHTGNNMVYSTIHPVFVRRVVEAIKEGGGKPFIADVSWDVIGAEKRGYSHEVIGCHVYHSAGPDEKYYYSHHHPYKNIQDWKLAGMIEDASFWLILRMSRGTPAAGSVLPSRTWHWVAWWVRRVVPCMIRCSMTHTGSRRSAPMKKCVRKSCRLARSKRWWRIRKNQKDCITSRAM